tara:strand:- start:970 stop:1425 length:456 start_codon:yes stop_codon:yes gene_type:complete
MAHFAKIGMNGKVLQVVALENNKILNADGVEDETVGQQYLQRHNNWSAEMWIQTSYNTYNNKHSSGDNSKAFRGNYAGIGHIWDEDRNIFYPKKPYPSWVLDESIANWKSPIGDAPNLTAEQQSENDAGSHKWVYDWNEDNQTWDITNLLE